MPKLKALRLLRNDWMTEQVRGYSHEGLMAEMSADLGKLGVANLQWLGKGDDIFKIGKTYEFVKEDGSTETRREISLVGKDQVQHVEIWYLDCIDINKDPVLPFSP